MLHSIIEKRVATRFWQQSEVKHREIRNRDIQWPHRKKTDKHHEIVEIARLETEVKNDKARAKSRFTGSRNKFLLLFEEQELPSRRRGRDACQKMDTCKELVMEITQN